MKQAKYAMAALVAFLLLGCSGSSSSKSNDNDNDNDNDTNTESKDSETGTTAETGQFVQAGGYVIFGDWKGFASIHEPSVGTIVPANFDDLAAGGKLCVSGVTEEDYNSNPWLAVNVNQEKDGSQDVGSSVPNTNALYVDVDNIGETPLRVQLIGADGTLWCADLTEEGGTILTYDSFNTKCWNGEGDYYKNEPLESISILVPGDEAKKFEFEFCLNGLEPREAEVVVDTDLVEIDSGFDAEVDTDPENHPGYKVVGRHLHDRCGEQVLLRGVNKMVVWTDDTGESFPEIEQTGANVVRIVWLTTGSLAKLEAVIERALANQLIPMIELHDATGSWTEGDETGKLGLEQLVDWWVTAEVVELIAKYETDLLVNIGNEVGKVVTDQDFLKGYISAVTRMREAGIKTPLIIDATNWGQNINILQKLGPTVFNHDPYSNVMFSVHMWWPSEWHDTSEWPTVADRVIGEIKESVDMNLPLIVGEFAHVGGGCVEAIPYLTIIEECQTNEIGWLAWSWGPGNDDCDAMDITSDSTFASMVEGWGKEVLITDTNSVANTAVRPYSIVNGACEAQ